MNLTPGPYCDRDNPRDTPFCVQCGGELTDVKTRQFLITASIIAEPMFSTPNVPMGSRQYGSINRTDFRIA